jgi:hypothetical protein
MSQTQLTSSKDELIARLIPFLQEVKDMTTSTEVEQWLNTKHGVESALYKDLARLLTLGVKDGWAAHVEIAGPRYRRSQLVLPSSETFFFSATAVLMDSTGTAQNNRIRMARSIWWYRSMKALPSQVRTAGVLVAGRHRRQAATTFRKSRAERSSRSLFCPQDGLRSTLNRRNTEALGRGPQALRQAVLFYRVRTYPQPPGALPPYLRLPAPE